MTGFPRTSRLLLFLAMITLSLRLVCIGQDASGQSPALGDVARATRKEHSAASHVAARQVTNEEEDGPDAGGVWRLQLCPLTPCYQISVALPRSPKWIRPAAEPRPVLIPLVGHEDDLGHAIRVYAAGSVPPLFLLERAQRTFLQGWFARPEYFGQGAKLLRNERLVIDGRASMITQFTVTSGTIRYRGLSVLSVTGVGNFGFACVFREEDANAAASVCDAIVNSARTQTFQQPTPRAYQYPNAPGYRPPGYYPRYYNPPSDDPDDPPEDDDPE